MVPIAQLNESRERTACLSVSLWSCSWLRSRGLFPYTSACCGPWSIASQKRATAAHPPEHTRVCDRHNRRHVDRRHPTHIRSSPPPMVRPRLTSTHVWMRPYLRAAGWSAFVPDAPSTAPSALLASRPALAPVRIPPSEAPPVRGDGRACRTALPTPLERNSESERLLELVEQVLACAFVHARDVVHVLPCTLTRALRLNALSTALISDESLGALDVRQALGIDARLRVHNFILVVRHV